ncbi:Arginine--tRNA ligase [Trichinella spiralis]|uniref:Arginine--tRNA ligase n=1 Tax=Trichinella spiralis TaxID=6334 RepID=A0ABR3K5B1_TRISP
MDPELDIYPFSAPLDFDINGVKAGSLETPLFCLTNEHPTCDAVLWKSHGQGHRWLFGKRAEVQGPRNYEATTEQDDQRLRTPKQNMPLKHVEIFIKDYDSMAPNKQASSE